MAAAAQERNQSLGAASCWSTAQREMWAEREQQLKKQGEDRKVGGLVWVGGERGVYDCSGRKYEDHNIQGKVFL